MEAFGWNVERELRDVLVWHTKTTKPAATGDDHGYVFEERRESASRRPGKVNNLALAERRALAAQGITA